MNLLKKTKTYLVGHMQYHNGSGWRQTVRSQLEPMGVTVFDPYDKPFIKDVEEGDDIRAKLKNHILNGQYDEVQKAMKEIRIYDLNLVDRSDFIIAHIIPDVASSPARRWRSLPSPFSMLSGPSNGRIGRSRPSSIG